MAIKKITDSDELKKLVDYLLSPERQRVVCIFTEPFKPDGAVFDYEYIDEQTYKYCDNYLIGSSDLTREMQTLMQGSAPVFNGSARTYPVGFSIDSADFAPLRQPSLARKAKTQEKVENDIWAAAYKAGAFEQPGKSAKSCQAVVKKLFPPSRVWLNIGDDFATLQQEITFPGIPVDWVFEEGQVLQGKFDAEDKLFILDGSQPTEADILKQFDLNDVTLGLVKETDRKHAVVALHPNVTFTLDKDEVTGNPNDTVDRYLRIGEVYAVRIYRHPEGKIRLRMDDIDDEEVIKPALPLVPGGKPWLEEDRDIFSDHVEEEEVLEAPDSGADIIDLAIGKAEQAIAEVPAPTPAEVAKPSSAENRRYNDLLMAFKIQIKYLNEARSRIQQLEAFNTGALEDLGRAQQKNRELREIISSSRGSSKQERTDERTRSSTFSRRSRFRTDEDWMREEIRRAWIGRYSPSDRDEYPLVEEYFEFSEDFFKDFTPENISEAEARKTVQVLLDVVTTRQWSDSSRRGHSVPEALDKGHDNLGTMHRIYIQEKTPQALRLILRKMSKQKKVVLIRVAKHDDF